MSSKSPESLQSGQNITSADVEVEDLGSETSQSVLAAEVTGDSGAPEDLVLLEKSALPSSREGSELSGFNRRLTESGQSGCLPDKDSVDEFEDVVLPPEGSGRRTGSGSRSSVKTSTSSELRLHLERKETEEEEMRLAKKKEREEEVAKVRRIMEEERRRKGVQILPGSRESRGVIQAFLSEEELMAMEDQQQELEEETEEIRSELEGKYGISKENKRGTGLVAMATEFYSSKEMPNEVIPERIRRNLTTEEIRDLKLVFDMFDAKGRGYIISYDLRRAAGMLGFRAKMKVFKEMIDELATDQKGKVTFINFLDFIVKTQGEGPDPYDDIIQGFRLLDTNDKGFLTFSDLRTASDHAHLSLSNKALREMLQEADLTGDGRITEVEFVRIMMETNTFKLTSKRRTRLK